MLADNTLSSAHLQLSELEPRQEPRQSGTKASDGIQRPWLVGVSVGLDPENPSRCQSPRTRSPQAAPARRAHTLRAQRGL